MTADTHAHQALHNQPKQPVWVTFSDVYIHWKLKGKGVDERKGGNKGNISYGVNKSSSWNQHEVLWLH